MKKILNKEIEISVPTKSGLVPVKRKYSDLIVQCVNNPPESGFTVTEMKTRLRIVDIAEKANGEMMFEETDINKIKECVKGMPWSILSKEIVEFDELIQKI